MDDAQRVKSESFLKLWAWHSLVYIGIVNLMVGAIYFIAAAIRHSIQLSNPAYSISDIYLFQTTVPISIFLGVKLASLFANRVFFVTNKRVLINVVMIYFLFPGLFVMLFSKLRPESLPASIALLVFNAALFYILSHKYLETAGTTAPTAALQAPSQAVPASPAPALPPVAPHSRLSILLLAYKTVLWLGLGVGYYLAIKEFDPKVNPIIVSISTVVPLVVIYRFVAKNLKDFWGFNLFFFTAAPFIIALGFLIGMFTSQQQIELEGLIIFFGAIALAVWGTIGAVISGFSMFYEVGGRPRAIKIFIPLYVIPNFIAALWLMVYAVWFEFFSK